MVYTITQGKEVVSDGGSIFWEILLGIAVSLPFFTLGLEMSLGETFDDAIVYSNMTIMWYQSAMLAAAAASAPFFAFVSQKFGRKTSYFCISLVQGLVFIPVVVATPKNLPYTYVLIGISLAGAFTTLLPFMRELTFKTRGFCLTMPLAMSMAGYQLRVFVREFYDPMTYMVLGLVAAQIILLMFIVESPSYLVMVGKAEWAKEALASIKRLSINNPYILKEMNVLTDEVARGTDGKITLRSLYRNKICWDSIKICVLLFTTMELCGGLVFTDADHACDCGIGLRDPNIIIAFVLAGSILTMLTITFWDRKYILTFGYIVMAISLGVYAVSSLVDPGAPVSSPALTTGLFLPVLLMAHGMASGLPAVILVELFNIKLCTPILAALFMYQQLLRLLHAYIYTYLDQYIGMHAMFYVYAAINLYGGVYALFVVPNIRNKSLRQIEKQVKRIPLPA